MKNNSNQFKPFCFQSLRHIFFIGPRSSSSDSERGLLPSAPARSASLSLFSTGDGVGDSVRRSGRVNVIFKVISRFPENSEPGCEVGNHWPPQRAGFDSLAPVALYSLSWSGLSLSSKIDLSSSSRKVPLNSGGSSLISAGDGSGDWFSLFSNAGNPN